VGTFLFPLLYLESLDQLAAKVSGFKFFFKLDLSKAFWQIPMDPSSTDMFSFSTPAGNFKPLRLPMGFINSVAELTERLNMIMADILGKGVLVYVDDILGYAKSLPELQELLRLVLTRLCKHNVLVNMSKSILGANKVIFCGRQISSEGVGFDPEKLNAVLRLDRPVDVAQLSSFYHAVSFFRTSIPEFGRVGEPLMEYLNKVAKEVGSRTTRKLKSSPIVWSEDMVKSFESLKGLLVSAATLKFPEPSDSVFLWTDASSVGHGAMVTFTKKEEEELNIMDRTHLPAGFSSGIFNSTQRAWSVIERELFAIVETIHRFRFIVCRPQGVTIMTDHANLKIILHGGPTADVRRYVAEKIQRWKARLTSTRFQVVHIPGNLNTFADVLSRFSNVSLQPRDLDDDLNFESDRLAIRKIHGESCVLEKDNSITDEILLKCAMVRLTDSALDPFFVIPDLVEIQNAQATSQEALELPIDLKDGLHKSSDGLVFIPDVGELRERLVTLAHSGRHKGAGATRDLLGGAYTWPGMAKQVKDATQSCIHCAVAESSSSTSRELGHLVRATKPREIIGLDFYSPTTLTKALKKAILTLKDDFSGFIWLKTVSSESAEEVV
jgi:hypothetical protein